MLVGQQIVFYVWHWKDKFRYACCRPDLTITKVNLIDFIIWATTHYYYLIIKSISDYWLHHKDLIEIETIQAFGKIEEPAPIKDVNDSGILYTLLNCFF